MTDINLLSNYDVDIQKLAIARIKQRAGDKKPVFYVFILSV